MTDTKLTTKELERRQSANARKLQLQRDRRKEAKLDLRLKDRTGVRRRLERDGMGREAWWWIASAYFEGKQHIRRWAVTAHGDREAQRLAIEQRQEWEQLQ